MIGLAMIGLPMIEPMAGSLRGSSGGMLLAAGGEPVILFLIVCMFVFVPLIGMISTKIRDMMQPPSAPPAQRATADPARIQSQIDEFLRRATQRRVVEDPKQGALSAARAATVVEAEIVDDEPIGDHVGREASKRLDTSDFRRRSQQLGEKVAQVDRQFNQQVQSTFSGEVSTLAKRRGATADVPVPLAPPNDGVDEAEPIDEPQTQMMDDTFAMFSSPEGFVQSLVMGEIMRRPNWDEEHS